MIRTFYYKTKHLLFFCSTVDHTFVKMTNVVSGHVMSTLKVPYVVLILDLP